MTSKRSQLAHHSHPAPAQSKYVPFKLIPADPGISQMDKTTLTLANTLAYLDGDAGIPRSLLIRAGCPQRRWNLDGEPENTSPTETGVASGLVGVLSSAEHLRIAIDQLCFRGALGPAVLLGGENRDVFRMGAGSSTMYKQSSVVAPQHGMLQALLLVCHAFPVDVYLDADFRELGSAYTPQLQYVITQHYDALQALGILSHEMRRTVAYAIIRSSHFSSTAWRTEAIERAEKIAANLVEPDRCLDMMILTQKIIQNRPSMSSEDFGGCSGFTAAGKKLNALSGQVFLSRSNMYMRNEEDIEVAFSLLRKIRPIDQEHISTLEELILQQKALCWGRLLRFQGQFEDARSLLEAVYDARQYPEGVVSVGESNCELISQLAETNCELGDLVKAEELVSPKLERIFEKTNNNTNLIQYKADILRLKFSQAEAALQQGEYWRAFDLYRDMNRYIWSTRGRQSWVRAVCRMHMGLARVHHRQGEWSFALKYWERALRMYEKHFDSQDFGTVVTYASIAYVKVRLNDMDGAMSFAMEAQELFKITGRQHWYTGLGTVWYDEMLSELKNVLKLV
ncbi:hypothetical protein TMatcc_004032 [Talaromyces marneffei ATCC 18224]|uniref:Uncharacterized protein n=1 Tax=Talaromyces marneffei (strain ATCC 18224 / CBS 334.59 / QM 7333) TaxID=441960 RepID=B6Q6Y1_TALMQ|nr:uncharacterized protein EYB26_000985 [Talaromyces marneffei]EEA27671.1 conserved hypothetical protein [Talaromyces marneffei ATCC 18224]KAE8556648.1 hypothetical protein EYB25_001351 [Talaromyces marneffei]QGA13337.1 hypothetical protein EYB26_000985 [Talaromyces marneffei]